MQPPIRLLERILTFGNETALHELKPLANPRGSLRSVVGKQGSGHVQMGSATDRLTESPARYCMYQVEAAQGKATALANGCSKNMEQIQIENERGRSTLTVRGGVRLPNLHFTFVARSWCTKRMDLGCGC